jgi:NlpC/P60 family
MSSQDIVQICQSTFPQFFNDCSGFVRSVAQKCGIMVVGNANQIVEMHLSGKANFQTCNESYAREQAQAGNLVLAGLSANGHGHVVVVVDEPLEHGHVFAYWGRYHGLHLKGFPEINVGTISFGRGSISKAWNQRDLQKVKFGWAKTSDTFLSSNTPSSRGYHL